MTSPARLTRCRYSTREGTDGRMHARSHTQMRRTHSHHRHARMHAMHVRDRHGPRTQTCCSLSRCSVARHKFARTHTRTHGRRVGGVEWASLLTIDCLVQRRRVVRFGLLTVGCPLPKPFRDCLGRQLPHAHACHGRTCTRIHARTRR